jgi:hypothetical protein
LKKNIYLTIIKIKKFIKGDRVMYARVARLKGEPSKIDDLLAELNKRDTPPGLEEMKGVYVLVDRDDGKIITITLWDDKQVMDKSISAGQKAWGLFKEIAGTGEPEIETYEVALKQTP